MMGGLIWTGYALNASFLLLFLEALFGVWNRWVLIFPLAYFGGYATLAYLSHSEYYSKIAEVEKYNAAVNVAFNITENDLVISGSEIGSQTFLTTYGLASVYEKNSNFKPKSHLMSTVGDLSSCETARKLGTKANFYTRTVRTYEDKSNRITALVGKIVPDICIIQYPSNPQKPYFEITTREESVSSWLLPLKLHTISIKAPDGKEHILKGGFASPLKWLPVPILGCGLNSARPAWECLHEFSRETSQPLNIGPDRFSGNTFAIARALGLKPVTKERGYSPRKYSIDIESIAKKIQEDELKNALDRFERLLSDPVSYNESLDFEKLAGNQKYYISQSSHIISALKKLKRFSGDSNYQNKVDRIYGEKVRTLSLSLSSLPLQTIKDNKRDIFSLLSNSNSKWLWGNKNLFIRLGDLGAESHIFLYEAFKNNQRDHHFSIHPITYAICRAGPEIKNLVGDLLLEELRKVSGYFQEYEKKRALLIPLSRIGLREEAYKIIPPDRLSPKRKGEEDVTESSPASVCVDYNGEPTYPD